MVAPSEQSVAGEVNVIIGPVFAGKTTALLGPIKGESNSGRNVVMIKPSKDRRYATDSVVTHDGAEFPCWALPDLSSFRQRFGEDAFSKLDVIGVDEAQFFFMISMIFAAMLLTKMAKSLSLLA